MPEGPEIRRAADRVARAVVGVPLLGVEFGLKRLAPYESELAASKVVEVTTRGKGMLTRFDCGLTVFSHNQLYGKWYVTARPQAPQTSRSLRFALYTERRWALLYSASTIEVVPDAEIARIPFLAGLGPDCLDRLTTPQKVLRRLKNQAFRNRSLATLLLDQAFIAGLGNYLRSEILFEAKIHPGLRPRDCDEHQLMGLARAIVKIPRRSYKTGGITCAPEVAAQLKAEGRRRRDYRHWVFRKGGQECLSCGDAIVDAVYGGRHLSYCASCQRDEGRG
ncbi:MAG: endonuclease VIII [Polyangiaceae bacterium]|nr:endonuclease VIII [Polyangiaceae bacterium]